MNCFGSPSLFQSGGWFARHPAIHRLIRLYSVHSNIHFGGFDDGGRLGLVPSFKPLVGWLSILGGSL
jgi:hypothetical protein